MNKSLDLANFRPAGINLLNSKVITYSDGWRTTFIVPSTGIGIWDFNGVHVSSRGHLGCDPVQCCGRISTF